MAETDPQSKAFPPYTYIPGKTPHPISDPAGHMYGEASHDTDNLEQLRWGLRLFNAGYYWEAHEAWETIWLQLPAGSHQRSWVQGLIKLAASGVKCLEGNANGAMRHATRAKSLFENTQSGAEWKELAEKMTVLPPVTESEGVAQPLKLAESVPLHLDLDRCIRDFSNLT